MEYVSKINIFGLKMMVKSGLEKDISNSSMREIIFPYFIKLLLQKRTKNYLLPAWKNFKKKPVVYVHDLKVLHNYTRSLTCAFF